MTDFDLLTEHSNWLKTFEADAQKAHHDLNTITPPRGHAVNDAQLALLIQRQQAWHDSMLTHYAPHAQRFQRHNIHGLAQALEHFLQDLREATDIYRQMQQDRRRSAAEAAALAQRTNTYIRDLQNQTFNEQRASWDRQNARWHANFMGQPQPGQFCSRCGSALHGHTGYNCPFCGATR